MGKREGGAGRVGRSSIKKGWSGQEHKTGKIHKIWPCLHAHDMRERKANPGALFKIKKRERETTPYNMHRVRC